MVKKGKGKSKAIVKKDVDPTPTDIVLLSVWQIMDENPVLKEVPKPTQDYIEKFLLLQPELKNMPYILKREHFLNLIVLSWMRDTLFVDATKAIDTYGDKWKEHVEMKQLRLTMKMIELSEDIMPNIFKKTVDGLKEKKITRRIITEMSVEAIEFTAPTQPQGEVVDADYTVVEKNGKKKPSRK